MKWILLTYILIISDCLFLKGQNLEEELYIPLEYQRAYEEGTRMYDGSVSPSYWQNQSEYEIKVKVDPYSNLLSGEAIIKYYNNSSDSLAQIVFHSYPDYYKAENVHAAGALGHPFSAELNSDGMIIEELYINEDTVDKNDAKRVSYWGT
jgi:hypothetical protein